MDSHLRVLGHADKGVFALGDCAVSTDRPLPPLAQAAQQVGVHFVPTDHRVIVVVALVVAQRLTHTLLLFSSPSHTRCVAQQAKYLAMVFNKHAEPHADLDVPSFQYKHLGACDWQGRQGKTHAAGTRTLRPRVAQTCCPTWRRCIGCRLDRRTRSL